MISKYIETSFLAFIQGFSEFIPVSSSAHLLIISNLNKFDFSSLQLDICLHLGSLIAILFYFKNELFKISENKQILILIILGSVPLAIVGFIFYKTGMVNEFRNLKVVAWTTLIFGILLYLADMMKVRKKINVDLNIKNILIIGVFQILALIPGVSRAGITLTAARYLEFNRVDSSKISFLLSIPALAGASFLGLKDVLVKPLEINYLIFLAVILSFLFSYITIKFFLNYINKFSLNLFVVYRILISLILFLIIYN